MVQSKFGEVTVDEEEGFKSIVPDKSHKPTPTFVSPVPPAKGIDPGIYINTSQGNLRVGIPSEKVAKSCGYKIYYRIKHYKYGTSPDLASKKDIDQHTAFSIDWSNRKAPYTKPMGPREFVSLFGYDGDVKPDCYMEIDTLKDKSWDKHDASVLTGRIEWLAGESAKLTGDDLATFCDASVCQSVSPTYRKVASQKCAKPKIPVYDGGGAKSGGTSGKAK